jgi:hypothetical protein
LPARQSASCGLIIGIRADMNDVNGISPVFTNHRYTFAAPSSYKSMSNQGIGVEFAINVRGSASSQEQFSSRDLDP